MNKVLYYIDKSKKPQQLRMFLYSLNRKTNLGEITNFSGAVLRTKFSGVHELTFTLPYTIVSKNKRVRYDMVDKINQDFKIKVLYGEIEEWFVVSKKKKSMTNSDMLNIEAHSLAFELSFQSMVDYVSDSYNCLQVLTDCLKGTNWTPGYINPSLQLQWRSFDVSSQTKLSFNDEISETFKSVVTYDTVNRKVNHYLEDEVSTYRGFVIGYGQYLTALDDEIDMTQIKTRLKVGATDKASINSANPTGQDYIDDFSLYLYPFERDENRNVIRRSLYLEDDVCHAILDYNELINKHSTTFSEYLKTKKMLRVQLTELDNERQVLEDQALMLKDSIAVAKQNNMSTDLLQQSLFSKQTEQVTKINQINAVQSQIKTIDANIKELNELLKFENNFTGEILEQMNDIIKVEEWSDNNQIDDEEYYFTAVKELSTKSILPVNLSLGIVNFFEIATEHKNWNRMHLGDIVRITHDNLGIDVSTKIAEIEYDFDDKSINLTISNTKRPINDLMRQVRLGYRVDKMEKDLNKRKGSWISTTTNFNERNDRISVKPTAPIVTKVSHKRNDNGSVDITVNWYFTNETQAKNADNIDGFKIFFHSDNSPSQHVFGSNLDENTPFEVSYANRTFTFPSSPANLYYSIGIQSYRRVDEDINKDGILFSNFASTEQPYQPEKSVLVKGAVEGTVNNVFIATTDTTQEDIPVGVTAMQIDPSNRTLNMRSADTEEFLPISAGDATSIGGKEGSIQPAPSTIPIRNEEGFIEGGITGDAGSVGGKRVEQLVTTDKLAKPNGVATLDANGKLLSTQLPSGGGSGGGGETVPSVVFGTYIGNGTIEHTISLGFVPKLVKIYTTNPTEKNIFLPSLSGGFTLSERLDGLNNSPTPKYGRLTEIGFVTGNDSDYQGNKTGTTYYYEAIM